MRLLVLHHAPSATLDRIADAVLAGAQDEALTGLEVVERDPFDASREDLLNADGYLLGTAAHFGYMSGALKDLFDRTFTSIGGDLGQPTLEVPGSTRADTRNRPFGLWVHGRYDVTGAVRSVQAITGALGWRQVAPVLELVGDVGPEQVESAYGLGATVGANLLN